MTPPYGPFSGPPQYGSPGWGMPPLSQPQPVQRASRRRPLLIAAAIVVLLGITVGALAFFGAFTRNVLDHTAVEDGVKKILTTNFGETDIQNVTCPADQPMRAGNSFTCTVTISGNAKHVSVHVTNDDGEYQVDAPQ